MAQVNKKHGFTIIEVMLFLAVSGALMAGLLIGTSSSIARQRYNDSVSSFSDLLKEQYTFVANVQNGRMPKADGAVGSIIGTCANDQNQNRGRSDCFIYGKLIEFIDADLTDASYYEEGSSAINDGTTIRVTTVVGNDIEPQPIRDAAGVIVGYERLEDLNPNDDLSALQAADLRREAVGTAADQAARIYDMEWNSRLVEPKTDAGVKGAILIVRSPLSGTIKTFITNGAITGSTTITSLITHNNQIADKRFCVASEDLFLLGTKRRMVRINKNGGNASAVETMPLDVNLDGSPILEDDKCQN